MVRALASHRCDLGSILAWCHIWAQCAVGSRLARRVFLQGFFFEGLSPKVFLRGLFSKGLSQRVFLRGFISESFSPRVFLRGFFSKGLSPKFFLRGFFFEDFSPRVFLRGFFSEGSISGFLGFSSLLENTHLQIPIRSRQDRGCPWRSL